MFVWIHYRLRYGSIVILSFYFGCGYSGSVDFLCVVFRGLGTCPSHVCHALLLFCVSKDHILVVLVCKLQIWFHDMV